MKLYLAGPMRGTTDLNHPLFDEWEQKLTDDGHVVVSPARLSRALKKTASDPESMRAVLLIDLAVISRCDAIGALPGWERSNGATAEVAFALAIGINIYDVNTMRRLAVPIKPWSHIGLRAVRAL